MKTLTYETAKVGMTVLTKGTIQEVGIINKINPQITGLNPIGITMRSKKNPWKTGKKLRFYKPEHLEVLE